jgi:hypothetical protein
VTDESGQPRAPHDRWAHRRAEPRPFAFIWTAYLLGGAALTVLRAGSLRGMDIDAARAPARVLLVLIGVGVCIVWPLIRLSQDGPERPVRAALADLFVVLCPAQAVLWPLTLIGRWTWSLTGAMACHVAAWAALVGAVIALGTGRTTPNERTWWMLACVALGSAAPALGVAAARPGAGVGSAWLAPSPITMPFVATAAHPESRSDAERLLWTWTLAAGGAAVLVWACAGARQLRADPRRSA